MNLLSMAEMTEAYSLFFLDSAIKATCFLLLIWLIDRCSRKKHALWRNLLWRVGIVGVLSIPLASLLLPQIRIPISADLIPSLLIQTISQVKYSGESLVVSFSDTLAGTSPGWGWMSVLVFIYLLGMIAMLLRLFSGMISIFLLVHRSQKIAGEPYWGIANTIKERIHYQGNIRFAISDQLSGPTQVGGFKSSVILFPAHQLLSWDRRELEMVITHELIHAWRWDFAINLLSKCALALYWFNPLVWLVDRQIRETSEHVCDDWTVALGSDHHAYAHTLLNISALLQKNRSLALGETMARKENIVRRIDRIIDLGEHAHPRMKRGWIIMTGLILTCGAWVLASSFPRLSFPGTYFILYGALRGDYSLTAEGHPLIGTSDDGMTFDVSGFDRFIIHIPSSSGRIRIDAIGLDSQWVDSRRGKEYAHEIAHFIPTTSRGAVDRHTPAILAWASDTYTEGPPDGITIENMIGFDSYYGFSTLGASTMKVYLVPDEEPRLEAM